MEAIEFLKIGLQHICDWEAYDHMLFLLALVAPYAIRDWRRILILISAFTIGHCLTLVLASLDLLQLDQDLIEFLIPVSIAITALTNVLTSAKMSSWLFRIEYFVVFVFGLIHGAGFSNFFKIMFSEADGIIVPLLMFNLGVELGQVIIVSVIIAVSWIALGLLGKIGLRQNVWKMLLSFVALGISSYWIIQSIMS